MVKVRTSLVTIAIAMGLFVASADAKPSDGPALVSKNKLRGKKKLCEVSWPAAEKPSKKTTDTCLQYWLYTYSYSHPSENPDLSIDDVFSMDATSAGGGRFTAAQFRAMRKHVARAYPNDRNWPVLRAIELFETSAQSYTTFLTMNCDLADSLARIRAGKAVTCPFEELGGPTLWLLRNAVYAARGRKFKHPDLNHYFYGRWKRPKEAKAAGLPWKIDPAFKDSMLSARDRKTVREIRAEEKTRKRSK